MLEGPGGFAFSQWTAVTAAGVRPLFQEVFNTLGVEHAYTQFFEVGRRSASQSLLRPSRNRAEALFDKAAKHRELAPLELSAEHLVVQYVVQNGHLSRLPFDSFLTMPKTGQNQKLAQRGLPIRRH